MQASHSHSTERDTPPHTSCTRDRPSPIGRVSMGACQDNERAIPIGFWLVPFAIVGMIIWVIIVRALTFWIWG